MNPSAPSFQPAAPETVAAHSSSKLASASQSSDDTQSCDRCIADNADWSRCVCGSKLETLSVIVISSVMGSILDKTHEARSSEPLVRFLLDAVPEAMRNRIEGLLRRSHIDCRVGGGKAHISNCNASVTLDLYAALYRSFVVRPRPELSLRFAEDNSQCTPAFEQKMLEAFGLGPLGTPPPVTTVPRNGIVRDHEDVTDDALPAGASFAMGTDGMPVVVGPDGQIIPPTTRRKPQRHIEPMSAGAVDNAHLNSVLPAPAPSGSKIDWAKYKPPASLKENAVEAKSNAEADDGLRDAAAIAAAAVQCSEDDEVPPPTRVSAPAPVTAAPRAVVAAAPSAVRTRKPMPHPAPDLDASAFSNNNSDVLSNIPGVPPGVTLTPIDATPPKVAEPTMKLECEIGGTKTTIELPLAALPNILAGGAVKPSAQAQEKPNLAFSPNQTRMPCGSQAGQRPHPHGAVMGAGMGAGMAPYGVMPGGPLPGMRRPAFPRGVPQGIPAAHMPAQQRTRPCRQCAPREPSRLECRDCGNRLATLRLALPQEAMDECHAKSSVRPGVEAVMVLMPQAQGDEFRRMARRTFIDFGVEESALYIKHCDPQFIEDIFDILDRSRVNGVDAMVLNLAGRRF